MWSRSEPSTGANTRLPPRKPLQWYGEVSAQSTCLTCVLMGPTCVFLHAPPAAPVHAASRLHDKPSVALIAESTADQCALASNERTKSEVRGMGSSETATAFGNSAARLSATPPHCAARSSIVWHAS
eukprot:scaffold111411_cov99-Phaeocystis_antarctica.AAC.1